MPWETQFDKTIALDKALDAFWSHGYEATSMQQLVDCTGVNRGSLYATYGDKRALFLAALERYDDNRRTMLREFDERYAPRDAIHRLFLAFTNGVSNDGCNRGCFMTNTALELADHDDEIRARVATAQADVETFFARQIRKGKAAGDMPADIKVAETARSLLASLLGMLVLIRSRPEKTLLKSIVDNALRRLE